MDDYIDFAIEKATILQNYLKESGQPNFVSEFVNQCIVYESLDRQRYEAARPSFIFCGLMHDSFTVLLQKGEKMTDGSHHCLQLSCKAVDALVTGVDRSPVTLSAKEKAAVKSLTQEFQALEEDIKYNRDRLQGIGDEKFLGNLALQILYIEQTRNALTRLNKSLSAEEGPCL